MVARITPITSIVRGTRDRMSPCLPRLGAEFAAVEPEKSYVAMLSHLPLRRLRTLPYFIWCTWQIQDQLKLASGLIGYTLRAKILRKESFTLSLWENEAALQRFVQTDPHRQVMRDLVGCLNQPEFQIWTVQGSEAPLVFERELHRLTQR